jgi:HlyD family type I secretion membrane fusion protein
VVRGQINIFNARRQAIKGQVEILRKRISVLGKEIQGLRAKVRAQNKMHRLVGEEIEDVSTLFRRGLAKKARLLALQAREAEIEGNRGENMATIARAEQQIAETHLRINELGTARTNEIVEQLQGVQQEIFDLKERIRSAEDLLARTDIAAPIDGTVVDLRVHTTGGVIGPGESILDIVPSGDRLVVEARVEPTDIDVVHQGLDAHVTLTSFNQRRTKPVDGVVVSVSADRLTDERSGQPYFLARVGLVGDVTAALGGASLYPGMPANVMIRTEQRTALDYFLKPLTASFDRAFREE